jgi:elongation factor Ts
LKKQAIEEGKPAAIAEKMVEGRVKKYYQDYCLMDQPFVKDGSKTIKDIVNETIAFVGEKITIRRFVRYEMGEGIEKPISDFASEVSKTIAAK